jgi:hypothetical protein
MSKSLFFWGRKNFNYFSIDFIKLIIINNIIIYFFLNLFLLLMTNLLKKFILYKYICTSSPKNS